VVLAVAVVAVMAATAIVQGFLENQVPWLLSFLPSLAKFVSENANAIAIGVVALVLVGSILYWVQATLARQRAAEEQRWAGTQSRLDELKRRLDALNESTQKEVGAPDLSPDSGERTATRSEWEMFKRLRAEERQLVEDALQSLDDVERYRAENEELRDRVERPDLYEWDDPG
jgi:hypothetical protein